MGELLYRETVEPRSDKDKKAIVNRLKRIEGQVRGIEKMVQDDRYCIDILIQISAIQAALKNVGLSITEHHLNHCVKHAIQSGDGDRAIEELLSVMKQVAK